MVSPAPDGRGLGRSTATTCADLTGIQRRCLRALVAAYVGWTCESHSGVKMSEVDQHLDETYFAWMGAVADDGPFYYRVHSPVVLISTMEDYVWLCINARIGKRPRFGTAGALAAGHAGPVVA
jgi:hypothetical protein